MPFPISGRSGRSCDGVVKPGTLYASPNALAPHYNRFRVAERLLLTGHSHQAWPDVGFEAQQRAWLDAAECVDEKWERAFAMAERIRRGFARLLDDPGGAIALGTNTHELVVRWLSALPLRQRPRLVTTTGEFHTIRRQLDRLAEEGIEVVKVPGLPAATLAERLAQTVDEGTAGVLVSAVLYENAHVVPHLGDLLEACGRVGAELLVDAYHALNVMPFSLRTDRLADAFVVGGGYKYCQLGEGNCFLRVPEHRALRPVITGWFSEFGLLSSSVPAGGQVQYGPGPDRFAGATYDPTSHYRAAAVFEFFERQGLTPALLREVSQHQVRLLTRRFDALDADPQVIGWDRSVPLQEIGGFLALRSRQAAELCHRLRERGVLADHREDFLRLGPAPYLSDTQLTAAMEALGSAIGELAGR
ncbi:MAG: kynureninase [Gemmatimonadales bacterium]